MIPLFAFFLVAAQPAPSMPATDPRIELVELQAERKSRGALSRAENLLAERPEWAHEMGLDFLRGHLLSQLNRQSAAAQAYAVAIGTSPSLRSPALLRLADAQIRLGHPELAAGVLARLLRQPTSAALSEAAAVMLVESLSQGGDCRVLRTLDLDNQPTEARRRIAIARIDCDLRAGRRENLAPSLLELLEEDERDLAAKQAADRFSRLQPLQLDASTRARLGAVFHQNRDFPQTVRYLEPLVQSYSERLGKEESGVYYQLVRSHFWNGNLERAVEGYGDLADRTTRSEDRARALYQQGRSYEQLGNWSDAAKSYRRSFLADREGEFSGSSLLAALRLEWRSGREGSVSDILDLLLEDRQRSHVLGRAMLFLASSDIVRGRSDRAGRWLSIADNSLRTSSVETAYWRGRAAELDSDLALAVKHYSDAVRTDPYHPLGQASQERLQGQRLEQLSIEAAQRLVNSNRIRDLALSWRLLGDAHPDGLRARERLLSRLEQNRVSKAFLNLSRVAPPDWPLWQKKHEAPEEKLLGLGMWSEASPVVLRHFPFSNLALAYTASAHLALNGRTERSLYMAEVLNQGVPKGFPPALLPAEFRKILYPVAYADKISDVVRRYGVDPYLLLSIFRQESRFDPAAVSPASARGLGQFVFPTAVRIAKQIDRWPLRPEDLEDPATSIELTAAYVQGLGQLFRDKPHQVLAAYNAGEAQSLLWQTYCYSTEPEEYLTKVGFTETRSYLEQVLRSRAHYREIHGPWPDPLAGNRSPSDLRQ